MVPVMVNTYFPPNQPTPGRCYDLGRCIREAIESWDSDARVAVMASGGLSHFVVDEDIDRRTLKALAEKDADGLRSLPREKLRSGTSEILNWVALGGAAEPMDMTLVDYVPGIPDRRRHGLRHGLRLLALALCTTSDARNP